MVTAIQTRQVAIDVAPGVVLRAELSRPSETSAGGLVLIAHASRLPGAISAIAS